MRKGKVVQMRMRNARQKRVTILFMLMALGLYLNSIAPVTRAYGEADVKEVVSEQYPSSTDARDGASPAPSDPQAEASLSPAPDDGHTPQPESSPGATAAQESPVPTETPLPTADASAEADTLATPEALSVRSMYLEANHFAAIGQTVTLELELIARNPSGQLLSRFGVRFQTSPYTPCKVKAITQADTVRFVNQTLLVDGARVHAGHVTVAGEALKLKLSLQPFPQGSEATSTKVSIALLDGSGNEVSLQEIDQENARIDLSITYHLREQPAQFETPAESAETTEPDAAGTEAEAPAPLTDDEEANPMPTEASTLDLTVEPDVVTDQEPENLDGSQPATEALPATEEPPAVSVTETPAENRQLTLIASIPYDQLKVGDTLTLQAQMIGYEGLNLPIRIQWQQHLHGQWLNVEKANGVTLTVAITPENLHTAWRYNITIDQ